MGKEKKRKGILVRLDHGQRKGAAETKWVAHHSSVVGQKRFSQLSGMMNLQCRIWRVTLP
jgi:hypothetical protein